MANGLEQSLRVQLGLNGIGVLVENYFGIITVLCVKIVLHTCR